MTATLQLSGNPLDQLRTTALGPFAGIYEGYLSDRGYAPSTAWTSRRSSLRPYADSLPIKASIKVPRPALPR